jgi:ribosomal protein S18 acetylase RimI-like enzyme
MIQAHLAAAHTFYISRIEVDPEVQNRGVGSALMQHLLERARQSGGRIGSRTARSGVEPRVQAL